MMTFGHHLPTKYTALQKWVINLDGQNDEMKKPTMSNYTIDNSPVTSGVLTTSYSYGTADKEYVFS